MCGRYDFAIIDNKIGQQIKEITTKLNLNYKQGEIFPSDDVLCVIPKGSKVDLSVKRWGIKAKSLLINARIETLEDKISFNSIKNNRCAIICNGFYEWDKDKNKYYITYKKDYFYLACIFNEDDELVILTTSSKDEMVNIHDRCPIVMNKWEMLKYIHNEECLFEKKKLRIKKIDECISLF